MIALRLTYCLHMSMSFLMIMSIPGIHVYARCTVHGHPCPCSSSVSLSSTCSCTCVMSMSVSVSCPSMSLSVFLFLLEQPGPAESKNKIQNLLTRLKSPQSHVLSRSVSPRFSPFFSAQDGCKNQPKYIYVQTSGSKTNFMLRNPVPRWFYYCS
jgi:hypothetical protein